LGSDSVQLEEVLRQATAEASKIDRQNKPARDFKTTMAEYANSLTNPVAQAPWDEASGPVTEIDRLKNLRASLVEAASAVLAET
jgi:hypothetical protein